MNSMKIGTYQMDTSFGLYLPEYTIPAPSPQTKFVKIIGRDGSVDLSEAIGLHYDSRNWSLDFKCFDPTVNWHTLSSNVMNAIHGKRLNFEFDDDPDYFWTGRISVSSYVSNRGTGTLRVNITSDPYKYKKLSTIVTKTASTGTEYTGSVVTFNTANAQIYDLSSAINATQDLHGYSKPWAAGAGKNLYSPSWAVPTSAGSTVTVNGEEIHVVTTGGTTYTGMASQSAHDLPAGTYYVKFKVKTGAVTGTGGLCGLRKRSNHTFAVTSSFSSGTLEYSFSGTITEACYFSVLGNGGSTGDSQASDFTLYDLIISTENVDYEPYSNICPIIGRTSAKIYRFGKNLFNKNEVSSADVTITQNSSGFRIVSNANGTYKSCYGGFRMHDLPDGTEVTFSAHCKVNAGKARISIRRSSDNNIVAYSNLVSSGEADLSLTYTYDKSTPVYLSMFCTWSESEAGDVEYTNVQLEIGSTKTDYVPYAGTTYTANWDSVAGTVYEGTHDPVTGELMSTMANIASYAGETIGEPWLSSMDAYAAGTTPTIGAQVVYTLATPQTYLLAQTQIEALTGTNNIWSNGGNVTVTVVTPETVTNNGSPDVPTLTASADMVLKWGNYSASVQQGTSTIPQLVLQNGANFIYIIGTGTISFEWSEESL